MFSGCMNINCGVVPSHYKYICILAFTTLQMTTGGAKTCQ